MFYSDDPVRDFEMHDREQQRRLDRLPKCDYCIKPIQGEDYYDIHGAIMCQDCLDREFRKKVEDYIS